MRLLTHKCPTCGAPLRIEPVTRSLDCIHCGSHITVADDVVHAADFHRAHAEMELPEDGSARARVSVGGVPYDVLGRLAAGESHEVHLAVRAHRIRERVVLKVLRASEDEDLLEREWQALSALHRSSARGAEHFKSRLPQLVGKGALVRASGARRVATVQRFPSGFVHTFEDVLRAYPGGVDAAHAVWMWRRILEVLSFVHDSGRVHGAVLPQHALVHARDHGVLLVGWSCSVSHGQKLPARSASHAGYYPSDVASGGGATAATDLAMSARTIARLLDGDPATGRVPGKVPAPIAALVRAHVTPMPGLDANELHARVGQTAREVYGPPRFVPFTMPGWERV